MERALFGRTDSDSCGVSGMEMEEIEDSSGDESITWAQRVAQRQAKSARWSFGQSRLSAGGAGGGACSAGSSAARTDGTRMQPGDTGGCHGLNGTVPSAPSAASPREQLFPHFMSLVALARHERPLAEFYCNQFAEDSGALDSTSHAGVAGGFGAGRARKSKRSSGARRATGKGKRGRRTQPTNTWRTRGGQKVYFDAGGKMKKGTAAMKLWRQYEAGGGHS